MTTRARTSLVLASFVLALGGTAGATPTFPGVLQAELALPETPSCTVCHAGVASRGTVTTPLGKALLSRGMVAGDEASLRTAIAALVAENNPEIRALKGGQSGGVVAPAYGCECAVTGAPSKSSSLASLAFAIGAVLFGVARRRR